MDSTEGARPQVESIPAIVYVARTGGQGNLFAKAGPIAGVPASINLSGSLLKGLARR